MKTRNEPTAHVSSPTHSRQSPPPARLLLSRGSRLQSRVPTARPRRLLLERLRVPLRGSSLGDGWNGENGLDHPSASASYGDGVGENVWIESASCGRRLGMRPRVSVELGRAARPVEASSETATAGVDAGVVAMGKQRYHVSHELEYRKGDGRGRWASTWP